MGPELERHELRSSCDLEDLVATTAYSLDLLWRNAKENGKTFEFLDAIENWVEHSSLPEYFYRDRGVNGDKELPPLQEAIGETVKRLRFLEAFTSHMPKEVTGVICGGSMSYGRFYNIRGGEDPSDIDLFVIVDNAFFSSQEAQRALIDEANGFAPSQTDEFVKRCRRFNDLYQSEVAQYMYHKIPLGNVLVSFKVISSEQFRWEFFDTIEELISDKNDRVVYIRGYSHGPGSNILSRWRNFSGQVITVPNKEEIIDNGEAIYSIPACIYHDGHLYTGDHHNHMFPLFSILYDRDGSIDRVVNEYKRLLLEEVAMERASVEDQHIDIFNAWDRLPVVSPYVLAEARERLQT